MIEDRPLSPAEDVPPEDDPPGRLYNSKWVVGDVVEMSQWVVFCGGTQSGCDGS